MESSKKTILVPVDFQEPSLAALTMARELAGSLGMDIVLLHVFALPVIVYPGFQPIMTAGLHDEIATAAKQALEQLAASVGGPQTLLRSGDPAQETVKAIEELRPAFVAMGTHGRKGLSHFIMGSVAEEVIRQSSAPVITVHAPEAKE